MPVPKTREYRVDYETRQRGSIGAFEVTSVLLEAPSAQAAVGLVGASLRGQGLETRMPVKVHRKRMTSGDFIPVPYTGYREAGRDAWRRAGLREDLLDDEEQARATTSELELALQADPQTRVKDQRREDAERNMQNTLDWVLAKRAAKKGGAS